uniref:Uncharacterized protein n=1 Tax=Rhizophora mucronata TaxID=61149 RepID=A0A2P2QQK3_RHIMU
MIKILHYPIFTSKSFLFNNKLLFKLA